MDADAANCQCLGLTNIPILVAEDDHHDVFFLRRALGRVGAQPSLHLVRNGQEVIDFLEGRAPFDDRSKFPFPKLLLMDLNMPLMGGLEVLAWLQERPERQQLRVVILSGSAAPADIKRAYALGADSCLQKPTADDLMEFVRRLEKYWTSTPASA